MLRTCTHLNLKFLFCFALFLGSNLMLEAQPVNDVCSGAIPFPDYNLQSPSTCSFSNATTINIANATSETEYIPSCALTEVYHSRWYLFEAPSETVDFSFPDNYTREGIVLYNGVNCENLTEIACINNDFNASGNLTYTSYASDLIPGNIYLMQIWRNFETGGTSGTFKVCISIGDPPLENDACSGAIPFPGILNNPIGNCDIITTIDNTGAKDESFGWNNCDGFSNYSQWFTFQPSSAYIEISSTGGQPGMAIFENNCDNLTLVDCYNSTEESIEYFSLNTNETYLMVVWDDQPGQELNFCLSQEPSVNDAECSDFINISEFTGGGTCLENTVFIGGDTILTDQYGVDCDLFNNYGQLFSFIPDYQNLYFNSNEGTSIAIWEGECNNLSLISCTAPGTENIVNNLNIGEQYFAYVYSFDETNDLSFCFQDAIALCDSTESLIQVFVSDESNIWSLSYENTGEVVASSASPFACIPSEACLRLDFPTISNLPQSYTVYLDGQVLTSGSIPFLTSEFINCEFDDCPSEEEVDLGINIASQANSWYSFTAQETGTYEISTCNNSCNTTIYIYEGCQYSNITELEGSFANASEGCGNNGNQANLIVNLIEGETYHILIGDIDDDCNGLPIEWELSFLPFDCGINEKLVQIFVTTDEYPTEISWTLTNVVTNEVIASTEEGFANGILQTYVEEVCVPNNVCLDFTINDGFGDGICCLYGAGGYEVYYDGELYFSGGDYQFSETTQFNCCGSDNLYLWYEDLDGDGLGNNEVSTSSCEQPDGFVSNNLDPCDNSNENCFFFNGKVLLEGPYIGNGLMSTNLQELISLNQPYDIAPYFYEGNEQLSQIPENMVDWLLIEAREGTPALTGQRATITIETEVGILLSDGSIIGLDGLGIRFNNLDSETSYHFCIRHRNHLDIVTANPIFPSENMEFDLTVDVSQALGSFQMKWLEDDGKAVMFAGDLTSDGVIQTTDYDTWAAEPAALGVYNPIDASLDGVIQVTDYDLWFFNKAKIGAVEIGF